VIPVDSIERINNKLKRNIVEMEELATRQEQLLEAITEAISEKDK
jgi:hypothetical protein